MVKIYLFLFLRYLSIYPYFNIFKKILMRKIKFQKIIILIIYTQIGREYLTVLLQNIKLKVNI
jgi:hypothetical protein